MPKLKKEYKDSRKKEIIWAAWQSFMEKGYEKTTIREIANRMDASTGIIYNYFKTKNEILEEMQKANEEILQHYFKEISQKETAREMLTDLFNYTVKFQYKNKSQSVRKMKKYSRGVSGLLAEALRSDAIRNMLNSRFGIFEKYVSGIIEFGIQNGEINANVNPKAFAGMFDALRWGLAMQTALVDNKDIKFYRENIAEMLLGNIWRD